MSSTPVMDRRSRPAAIKANDNQPPLILSIIWFLVIGWWASAIWIHVAWFLNVLILTMPIGLLMLNMVPRVATLREPSREYRIADSTGDSPTRAVPICQHAFLVRAGYFLVFGWWLSLLWVYGASALAASIIGLPVAFWMYNRVPAVTTLRRY
ncbi:hypothetical protein [Nitrolancea hollandica]|uniref:YccF domain-containing protein n=1 Tax=Nitrolancea hollandica Lb TaxID=1129897 RepID=I4ECM4_9BACT|nr:hypothetical protein [Nitrolancea hollandica]CCF82436.1 conserved membrane hypothetical protein [Nitrolancea hollandica Lb]